MSIFSSVASTVFSPPKKKAPIIANPYEPTIVPSDPGMNFGDPSQPDPVHDIYMPRFQQVNSQLADLYAPRQVGFGRELAGNLVGAFTHNPALGGLITGETQRQKQIQNLTGEEGSLGNIITQERAQRAADLSAQNVQSEITDRGIQAQQREKALNAPAKVTPEEEIWQGYLKANNGDPVAARQAQLADAQKAPNPTGEDKAISDHLASLGLADTPANRDKARLDLVTRSRQPKEPTTEDKAISDWIASQGIEDNAANRTKARQELKLLNRPPNQQETTRADMAENLNENLDQLEEVLNRRGNDLFGPLNGRMTSMKEFIGTNDPDIGTLKAIEDMMGRAQTSAHGMRNGQLVERAAQSILNSFKNGPDAVRAAIKAARSSVKTFQNDVDPTARQGGAAHNDPLGIR